VVKALFRLKALDRKLMRDLRAMWSQALTIALVVASGAGGFITSLSAVDSLAVARDRFYATGHFADVFASVKRAPNTLVEQLRQLDGVADVQATLEQVVRVELQDSVDPVIGQLIGLDKRQPARMNQLQLRTGKMPTQVTRFGAGDAIETLVSAGFAKSRSLSLGSRLHAMINGKRKTLLIVGIAVSPEFIFAGLGGMPDMRGFGIFWVDKEVLAAAYNMQGAFTRIAVKLAPQAAQPAVIAALSSALSAYGGFEAYAREDQTSHAMLNNEIKEQRVIGTVLPSIFLGVAAFLLNVVVSRLISTQREQIATLKAVGYSNSAIALHYLEFVVLIVLLGLVFGVWIGDVLGSMFTGLYAEFFHFPSFEHRVTAWLWLASGGITIATAVLGTLSAIIATVSLAPAEAMRPPAPGRYRRTLLERWGVAGVSPAVRMILRHMERRPYRTALSISGVAVAVAIVVLGNFFRDAIDFIVDSSFNLSMRSDVIVGLVEPNDSKVRYELTRLPGVIAVEASRDVAVRLINGHLSHRGSIQGLAAPSELRRIIDISNKQYVPSGSGLVISDRLANKLGVRTGDRLMVETLGVRHETLSVAVDATVRDMMGLNAYMERSALNRLLGEGDISSSFALSITPGSESALLEATKDFPMIASAFSKSTLRRNLQEISARNVRIMSTILTVFASVIAVGVVYNNARIALAERTWELASLRVLGFTRGEVSALLLGEIAITIAIALPLGMLLGYGLTHLITELLKSDQFFFPVVISARTYAWSAQCVVIAGVVSALVVRRRIDRLDMVAALKTRE
jgi:putative ABC transport system permease protein